MRRKGTWMLGVCTCAGAMNLRTRRFCLCFVSPLPFQDTRFHSLVFDVIVFFPLDQMKRERKMEGEKKKSESSFSDFITRANQATKVLSSLSFRESMERHTEVETETVNFEGDIPPVPVLNSTSYISHSWRSTHLTNDTTSSRVHACQTRRSRSDEKRKATYFDPFPFFSSSFFPSLSFSISFHNLTTWRGYIYMYIYVCTFTVNGNKHEVHTMMK